MPKKPNYDFERRERDRLKAAKTAAKAAAKAAAKLDQRQREEAVSGAAPSPSSDED